MGHPTDGFDALLRIIGLVIIFGVVFMAIWYPWKGDGGGSMG